MRHFYELAVKDKLEKYVYAKESLKIIEENIKTLKSMDKNKNLISKYGLSIGKGKAISQEELILNINAEIEALENNYKINMQVISMMDKAMEDMSDSEKEIVLTIYGHPNKGHKLRPLMHKYHYEKSQIYRIAQEGLRHISLRLYGGE